MNKAISAAIGVGIGIIALVVILFASDESEISQNEPPMGVELSDEIKVESEESKSFDVNISEGVELGDGSP